MLVINLQSTINTINKLTLIVYIEKFSKPTRKKYKK